MITLPGSPAAGCPWGPVTARGRAARLAGTGRRSSGRRWWHLQLGGRSGVSHRRRVGRHRGRGRRGWARGGASPAAGARIRRRPRHLS